MLKGKYLNLYKKRGADGTVRTVFRYLLSGGKAMLDKYRNILEEQGIPVYEDDNTGQIIYFTTIFHAPVIDIDITPNNSIVVVNDTIEQLESKLQLVQDPTLKRAMADRIAEMVLGGVASPTSNAVASAGEATAEVAEEGAGASEEETDM
jgi:hypothetical protein